MNSAVAVQELNLNIIPTSPPSSTINPNPAEVTATDAVPTTIGLSTPAPPAFIIPKKEPKLEPLDEPLGEPPGIHFQSSFPFYLNYSENNAGSSSNLTFNPSSSSSSDTPLTTRKPVQENVPSSSSNDSSNVYSEFFRISELFHTALAQGMQNSSDGGSNLEETDNSRAIVPVDSDKINADSQVSNAVVPRSRKYAQRSSELVRVTDLSADDVQYFRDIVRRTRMVYDSLRVFTVAEDEKTRYLNSPYKRARGDLKAAQWMRERGLWLNRDKRIVGSLPGVEVGDLFFFRMELCVVGLHGQVQAGIDYLSGSQSSNGEPIATSVIVSGGYEDDEDTGDVIIYTGHGGQDKFGRQCMHQRLEGGNLALERSMYYGIEVRVIRGFRYEGSASGKVYVYDGLYRIMNWWPDSGRSGFQVLKYRLVRIENQAEMGSNLLKFAATLRTRPLDVRPRGYVTFDLSMKKEALPVFLFNDVDDNNDPVFYEYLLTTIFPAYVHQHSKNGTGCDCVGGCAEGCFCAMKNGGQIAYDQNGILVRGKPLIFECGPSCSCPPTCRNRVSQRGVRNRLEVFRSRETGWGVRSLDLIQAGSFICEFAGVVLTREQAQIFTMNGDSLVYPSRFTERWVEWGDLSEIFPDYVRPSYPSIPPLDFAMDVSRLRNAACYLSHSSSPNVFVQPVLYDHNNVSFPHLMLFAMENIPPLREISLDYGVDDEYTGKLSICN